MTLLKTLMYNILSKIVMLATLAIALKYKTVKIIQYHCIINWVLQLDLYFINNWITLKYKIHGLIVTNITSINGSIFLVSMHSTTFHTLQLLLSGSTFVNNNNSLHQLISCLLNATHRNLRQSFWFPNPYFTITVPLKSLMWTVH